MNSPTRSLIPRQRRAESARRANPCWSVLPPGEGVAVDGIVSIRNIRLTRSWPDRIALPYERRETYAAALQQFEELIGAALVAGPASAPLPLFNALSQTGHAITAAFLTERWGPWVMASSAQPMRTP